MHLWSAHHHLGRKSIILTGNHEQYIAGMYSRIHIPLKYWQMSYATSFCLVDLVIAEVFQISFISFMKYGFCFLVYLMTVSSFLILLKEFFNLYFACIYFYKMRSKPKILDFVFCITLCFKLLCLKNADVTRLQKSQIQHSE